MPPPPEVLEMPNPIPSYPDDGLHRFVVTPVSTTGADGAEVSDLLGGGDGDSRSLWSIHPDRIDEVGPDTVLVFENGRPGYYDTNGEFVPVDGPTPDAEPEPPMAEVPTGPWEHAALNALDADSAVRSIEDIGDGTYAVVASDAEAVTSVEGLVVADDLPLAMADDPYYEYQWGLENHGENLRRVTSRIGLVADADVDGTEAATMATGEGVVVAVVDTGVNFEHPDLVGSSWINDDEDCDNGIDDDGNGYVDDCRGWDFEDNDNQTYSRNHHPHGTHVAGIIAANAGNDVGVAGVAPDVQIMDLSVSSRGSIRTSAVARAIRYAVDNGADVVNLSLGSAPGTDPRAVAPMIDAVYYAEENGVLLVISAGNAGVDLDNAAVYPASVDATNVLTVGASMPDDTRAGFSNHGTAVDLFAPGVLILSTMSSRHYAFMSGTSQAAPMVAGAAALVLEQKPSASDTELIEHLVATGDVVPAFAGYTPSSARLNAGRAVGADLSGEGPGEGEESPIAELVSITGLASATTDAVEATVTINTPEELAETEVSWEASLVAIQDDGIYAVVEHGVTVAEAEVFTNDRGALTLGTDPTMVADLATTLPAGDYGLVVEAVSTTEPDVRLGDAYVAAFTVTEAGGGATDPGEGGQTTDPTDGTDPGSGTTPTTAPSGGSGGTTATTTSGSSGGNPSSGSGGTTATTRSSSGSGGTTATTTRSSSGGTTATTTSGSSGGNPSSGSGGTTATTRSSSGSGGTTATTTRSS
ncbi:MAG: S8 family peptidase, partial [Actinomycetota bacterium]